MGREAIELRATTSVSRHNSPRDDQDNAAWNAFVAAVQDAAEENALDIDVHADGDLPTAQWGWDCEINGHKMEEYGPVDVETDAGPMIVRSRCSECGLLEGEHA